MITINEENARRAKENRSFDDYKAGSATAEYEALCDKADERAAQFPDNPNAKDAAIRYKREMGEWINRRNARDAGHVSQMISGCANYDMKKHNKWMAADDKSWQEYAEINERFEKNMKSAAKPVIHDSDADALDQLRAKLEKEEAEHAKYIDYNKTARKAGKDALPAYMLQNSNGRIKALRDRIERLEKAQEKDARRFDFDGGYVEENKEAGRTQIFFDEKPDEETRDRMKSNGWRWAPSFGAWQRQMTNNAWYDATKLLKLGA